MADVFISYARTTALQARAAAEALRASGYSVWMDEDLPTHRAYADVIAEQISAAKAVIVIWSSDAVGSEWVRSEADRARSDRKLVQLKVETIALPMPFDQIQCADLQGWDGGVDTPGWRNVLASIAELTRSGATAPVSPAAQAAVPRAVPGAPPVLAVLPFDNLSSDPEMQAFADGVSEEIIQSLGRDVGFQVIGRTASFRFRGDQKAGAAQALKASHLLDGTVRSAGPRVRIAAELTVAATGAVLWSDRYDRDATDLFALQDEIAGKVAAALRLSLAGAAAIDPAGAPPAAESEHRQVTVLFAEVDGLADLAEHLDQAAATEIKRRFFEVLAEGVESFEGFVEKVTPGGLVALFGAPTAHEDHAQRACYAAIHLQAKVAGLSEELKQTHGLEVTARMGLNSGDVVVGLVGDDVRKDYAAQGRAVGVAQRMQALAEPGSCYLSAATAALVDGYVTLDDLGEAPAMGASAPPRAYRLRGLGASRTRLDVSRSRGLSRFVGRETDLRTLEDALDQTAAGNGQMIGVVAEAGTGKSRLCFEFLQYARARGMQVYESRAVAHGRNISFLPILELLRAYLGVNLQDEASAARGAIEARMLGLDPAFAEALPLVFDFLGVADPARPPPTLSADARQRQLIGVISQLVKRLGDEQPIVTMIEDLHWLDAASAEFLEQIIDARSGARSLLLLNFRPEFRASWMGKSFYRQIPLAPLDAPAVGELLTELLGDDPSVAPLAAPVHARTGGNPFFIEEVVHTLVETGHLQGPRGARRLVTPVDSLEVPTTVQAVLAARIDRLEKRDKRLLQVAAVIGKDFSEPLLAEVAELAPAALKEALAALKRAEFIYETSVWPAAEYAFRHPLTQEVALGTQLRERRRRVHGAVARAIEQQHAGRLDEQAALLATHWSEAGEPRKAMEWWLRAARRTLARFATGEALTQIRHGLAELERLPEDEARWRSELELQLLAGNALQVTQGHGAEATAAAFSRALALCEKLPSSPHRMAVEYGVETHMVHRLELDRAYRLAEGMLAVGDRENSSAWRFVGLRARGQLRFYRGQFAEAIDDMQASVAAWRESLQGGADFLVHDPGHISLHCYTSYCMIFAGRLAEARREVAAASQAARASGHHLIVAQCIFTEGNYEDDIRATDRARALMEQTLAYAIEHDVAYFKCIGSAYLGTLVGLAGEPERGLELLNSAVAFQKTTGSISFMPGYLARQAELLTMVGRPTEAMATFDEALDWVDRTNARWDESTIRRRRAKTLTALGQHDAAEAELFRALDIAASQGAPLCEAQVACDLAPMLMKSGRAAQAREVMARPLSFFGAEVDIPLVLQGREILQRCDEPVAAEP